MRVYQFHHFGMKRGQFIAKGIITDIGIKIQAIFKTKKKSTVFLCGAKCHLTVSAPTHPCN